MVFMKKIFDIVIIIYLFLAKGISPISLNREKIANVTDYQASYLVIPRHATVVYNQERINQAFLLLLLLMVVGEFFSSPSISLADSSVLTYLGEECGNYGRQRMFGKSITLL